ncbi:MAG: hypothetical protein ABI134_18015 [Byssovorax sp.]
MDLYKHSSPVIRFRADRRLDTPLDQTWLQAYGPPLLIIVVSLLVLDGCQAVKGIFAAGFGVGVIVVLAMLAVIGGIMAMVVRKK